MDKVVEEMARQTYENLAKTTRTDPVTGLFNRRYLNLELGKLAEKSEPFSVLYIDIDGFKAVNDTYGHDTGDHVLRGVGEILKTHSRPDDIGFKYGGEELVLITRGEIPQDSLEKRAEQIRKTIEDTRFRNTRESTAKEEGSIQITVSIGAATRNGSEYPFDVVKRADDAMRLAKSEGKNRVKTEFDLKSYE